jgi:hypothetical protein
MRPLPVWHPWTTRLGAAQAVIGAGALAAGSVGGAVTLVFGFALGWTLLCAVGALLLASSAMATLVHAYRERPHPSRRGAGPVDRPAEVDVRRTLIGHRRVGDELVGEAARWGRHTNTLVSEADAQDWTSSIMHFLFEHGSPHDQERFLTAGTGPQASAWPSGWRCCGT